MAIPSMTRSDTFATAPQPPYHGGRKCLEHVLAQIELFEAVEVAEAVWQVGEVVVPEAEMSQRREGQQSLRQPAQLVVVEAQGPAGEGVKGQCQTRY